MSSSRNMPSMEGKVSSLKLVPFLEELGDGAEKLVRFVRVGLEGHQELRGAHEEGRDIQRTARDGEADLVAHILQARAHTLEPVEHERQQTVRRWVRFGQVVYLRHITDRLIGEREFVLVENALGAESGWLGAHAKFRPEPGQKSDLGKRLDGLAVGLEPQSLVGEVIQDVDAKPVRQPRGINDEPYERNRLRRAVDHREQFVPLAVSHKIHAQVPRQLRGRARCPSAPREITQTRTLGAFSDVRGALGQRAPPLPVMQAKTLW